MKIYFICKAPKTVLLLQKDLSAYKISHFFVTKTYLTKLRGGSYHLEAFHNTGEFYMESGKLIPEDIVKEVVDLLNEADSDCQEFAHKEIAAPPELSVGRVFREKFLQYMNDSETDHPDRRELKKAMYHWVLRWVTFLFIFCCCNQ